MKHRFRATLFIIFLLCLSITRSALAESIFLRLTTTPEITQGNELSLYIEAIAPPQGFALAGCAITLHFDPLAFQLASVTSPTFKDFASSGITPATIDLEGETYSSPLIFNNVNSGEIILSAVRATPLTISGNEPVVLFELHFSVPEDAAPTAYSFSLTNSTLTDTAAGYPATGGLATAIIGAPLSSPLDEIASYSAYSPEFSDWTIAVLPRNDLDHDGILDEDEILYGTDPNNSDTDGDGLVDGQEVASSSNPLVADSDGDGTPDGYEILAGTDPNNSNDIPKIAMEAGEIQVTGGWQSVSFKEKFCKPVIVANPLSLNKKDSAIIQIRNVTATDFDIRIEGTSPGSETLSAETVSYLAVEAGYFKLGDNSAVVAKSITAGQYLLDGTVKTVDDSFKTEAYPFALNNKPIMLAAVTSVNEETPAFVRIHSVTAENFQFLLQEPEGEDQIHEEEQISYIAWESSQGIEGDIYFEAAATAHEITDIPSTINYQRPATQEYFFLAELQTTTDRDPANLRYSEKTTSGATVLISEDISGDAETQHRKESVGYLVVGLLTEEDRDNDGLNYYDEVFVHGTDPGNADCDEDNLLDGLEVTRYSTDPLLGDSDGDGTGDGHEVVAGTDPLNPADIADIIIEVGDSEVDQNWRTISFTKTFSKPVVVAKPLSANESDFAVVRIRNVTATGFEIKMQEPSLGTDGIHAKEMVSYLAVESGSFILDNGAMVTAGQISAGQYKEAGSEKKSSNSFTAVSFPARMAAKPVVLAAITSINEETPVTIRLKNVADSGFSFLLQEPEAEDQIHEDEMISYIAWQTSSGHVDNISFEIAEAQNKITNIATTVGYNNSYATLPVVLADIQTTNDKDTVSLRYTNKTTTGFTGYASEETSADQETVHDQESVGYMVFSNF